MSDYCPALRRLTCDSLLVALANHVGRDRGLPIASLVFAATGRRGDAASERKARSLVSELRMQGYAICGHPRSGYWMAANAEELDECCQFLRSRAMHSLTLESRLRRMALPDLLNQLRITT